jgi:hypothetical protein
LHAPVERASADAELARGPRNVAFRRCEGLLHGRDGNDYQQTKNLLVSYSSQALGFF